MAQHTVGLSLLQIVFNLTYIILLCQVQHFVWTSINLRVFLYTNETGDENHNKISLLRFEVFMVVKIQTIIFWVMTPSSLVSLTQGLMTGYSRLLTTIQINHQPDATIFQFFILTFIYSSTYFECFPVHHQELDDCSGSLWFYLRIMVTVMLYRTIRR